MAAATSTRVRLIANNGDFFVVSREVAIQSGLVLTMLLDEDKEEGEEFINDQEIPLPNISANALALVIEFCALNIGDDRMITITKILPTGQIVGVDAREKDAYLIELKNNPNIPYPFYEHQQSLQPVFMDFISNIGLDICIDTLISAADYMEIESLKYLCAAFIAANLKTCVWSDDRLNKPDYAEVVNPDPTFLYGKETLEYSQKFGLKNDLDSVKKRVDDAILLYKKHQWDDETC